MNKWEEDLSGYLIMCLFRSQRACGRKTGKTWRFCILWSVKARQCTQSPLTNSFFVLEALDGTATSLFYDLATGGGVLEKALDSFSASLSLLDRSMKHVSAVIKCSISLRSSASTCLQLSTINVEWTFSVGDGTSALSSVSSFWTWSSVSTESTWLQRKCKKYSVSPDRCEKCACFHLYVRLTSYVSAVGSGGRPSATRHVQGSAERV